MDPHDTSSDTIVRDTGGVPSLLKGIVLANTAVELDDQGDKCQHFDIINPLLRDVCANE